MFIPMSSAFNDTNNVNKSDDASLEPERIEFFNDYGGTTFRRRVSERCYLRVNQWHPGTPTLANFRRVANYHEEKESNERNLSTRVPFSSKMRQESLQGFELISRTTTQLRVGIAPQLILLGPPGVGKGTFASKLAAAWKIPQISTGDIIRTEIANGTEEGRILKEMSDMGELVPDDLVIAIVQNRLDEDDTERGFILDGFPRTVYQAQALDVFSGPLLAINLVQSQSILVAKLAGRRVCVECKRTYNVSELHEGDYDFKPLLPSPAQIENCKGCRNLQQRADDREEVIVRRLEIYDKATQPLVDYYGKRGMLETFHVKRGVEDFRSFEKMVRKAGRLRSLF